MATCKQIDNGMSLMRRVSDVLGLELVKGVKIGAEVESFTEIEVKLLLTPEQINKLLGKE